MTRLKTGDRCYSMLLDKPGEKKKNTKFHTVITNSDKGVRFMYHMMEFVE